MKLLEFKHFTDFFSFVENGDGTRSKVKISKITVVVSVHIVMVDANSKK